MIKRYAKQEMLPGSYSGDESQRRTDCALQLRGKPVRKYTEVHAAHIVRSESPAIVQSSSSLREASVRQSNVSSMVCEVDRSGIKLYFSGTLTGLQLAVFTGACSNRGNEKGHMERNMEYDCRKAFERGEKSLATLSLPAAMADRLTCKACHGQYAKQILPYQRNRKNDERMKRCMIVVKFPRSIKCLRIHSKDIDYKRLHEYRRSVSYGMCGKGRNRSRMKYITVQIRAPALDGITKRTGF